MIPEVSSLFPLFSSLMASCALSRVNGGMCVRFVAVAVVVVAIVVVVLAVIGSTA